MTKIERDKDIESSLSGIVYALEEKNMPEEQVLQAIVSAADSADEVLIGIATYATYLTAKKHGIKPIDLMYDFECNRINLIKVLGEMME